MRRFLIWVLRPIIMEIARERELERLRHVESTEVFHGNSCYGLTRDEVAERKAEFLRIMGLGL